jgi:hypothetical protein
MLGGRLGSMLGGVAIRNPLSSCCVETEVLDGVDGVTSHVHPDHFDDAVLGLLPRNLPIQRHST